MWIPSCSTKTDSETITVFDAADGEATDGWVTAETDVWAFAGDDVEVVVRTEGNATIEVDYVSVMIDSTDDGIPDAVEAMDLRMPVGPPGVVGTPLNLDPMRADTSGDGILDAEQVDVAWAINGSADAGWHLEAEVLHASAHPGRVDTTGDGLTDRQQIEGWTIQVVDNHDDAEALMAIVNDPDAEADPSRFFTTREVGADPLAVHTDGDGLSDAREFELGTDPERADTTGDGVNDRIALTRDLEDPTVFTTTAPQAQLLGFTRWSSTGPDGPQWFFQYHYKVEDPAGVARYKLSRKGMTVGQGNGWGAVSLSDYDTFESLSEGGLSVLRASQVNIETTDIHGNTWTRRLHSHTSVVGSGLVEFSPAMAGTLSGFTHGAAESTAHDRDRPLISHRERIYDPGIYGVHMTGRTPASAGWFENADASDPAGLARSIREGGIEEPQNWPSRATEAGFADGEDDYYARLHEATIHATREAVRERERADDQQLKHAVRAMDDCDRVANELAERVSEWAGSLGIEVAGVDGAREVAAGEPNPDEQQLGSLASRVADLADEADDLRTFIESRAPSVAPNLSAMAGPVLAARLIALAGGLEQLAKMSSSTVQVLGAEDALFAHLRGQGSSPKHGVIFTHEYVRGTAPDERGSAARALAGKLTIAARVDHYAGERRPELDEELDRRIRRIRTRGEDG